MSRNKNRRRGKKAPHLGLCLPPAYVWAVVTITIVILILGTVLILKGEPPKAVCVVLAALGVVAAGVIRRVFAPARRMA